MHETGIRDSKYTTRLRTYKNLVVLFDVYLGVNLLLFRLTIWNVKCCISVYIQSRIASRSSRYIKTTTTAKTNARQHKLWTSDKFWRYFIEKDSSSLITAFILAYRWVASLNCRPTFAFRVYRFLTACIGRPCVASQMRSLAVRPFSWVIGKSIVSSVALIGQQRTGIHHT